PGQPLCAETSRRFSQCIDAASGDTLTALHNQRLDNFAFSRRFSEYLELAGSAERGDVIERHLEPEVRLVRSIARHGLGIRQPWERRRKRAPSGVPEDGHNHPLHQIHDLFAIDEGHLEVDLGKFRLTVVAEVFVAETAGDLIIAIHTADHEHLLEELW